MVILNGVAIAQRKQQYLGMIGSRLGLATI